MEMPFLEAFLLLTHGPIEQQIVKIYFPLQEQQQQ